MRVHGGAWVYMGLYGVVWDCMGLHGFSWRNEEDGGVITMQNYRGLVSESTHRCRLVGVPGELRPPGGRATTTTLPKV